MAVMGRIVDSKVVQDLIILLGQMTRGAAGPEIYIG